MQLNDITIDGGIIIPFQPLFVLLTTRFFNMPYQPSPAQKKKFWKKKEKKESQKLCPKKTYNSRYSLVVTHPTTNLPIWGLCMAERTGCPILLSLWSYVIVILLFGPIKDEPKI